MTARLPRTLDAHEARVLGALLEKQLVTPDAYPLSLSALVAACNQKTAREPVLELPEREVLAALERLREHVLVWKVTGGRVDKWEHNLELRWSLTPPQKALMALLLLRGPQTPGELRGRSERLHDFAGPQDVETALGELAAGPEPLVAELPRRLGQKERRFAQVVTGPPAEPPAGDAPAAPHAEGRRSDRIDLLEERVGRLEAELADLRRLLGGR